VRIWRAVPIRGRVEAKRRLRDIEREIDAILQAFPALRRPYRRPARDRRGGPSGAGRPKSTTTNGPVPPKLRLH
jgi:hypothetical protein